MGPLGKGDPKFSAGRFRGDETEREDGGDKIPRTRRAVSRPLEKGAKGEELPRAWTCLFGRYTRTTIADICKLGRLLAGTMKRVRA